MAGLAVAKDRMQEFAIVFEKCDCQGRYTHFRGSDPIIRYSQSIFGSPLKIKIHIENCRAHRALHLYARAIRNFHFLETKTYTSLKFRGQKIISYSIRPISERFQTSVLADLTPNRVWRTRITQNFFILTLPEKVNFFY